MNFNEKIIQKVVGILLLLVGLLVIIFSAKEGYTSFESYVIPLIFVAVSLYIIFNQIVSRICTAFMDSKIMSQPKIWIMMHAKFIFFILPLSGFSLIGFFALYYVIRFVENVSVVGWVTLLLLSIMPLVIIYFLIYGYSISEKKQKEIDARLDVLSANDLGISIDHPLFDITCFISWNSIDAIIYYNFYVSSDFTEYYEGYKLYLNTIPVYKKYEKQWWLNKLFPIKSSRKIIDIKVETKHFRELPKMLENYRNIKTTLDFKNPMKGTLISKQTYQYKDKITQIEKWKPNNNEEEQILFDKFNRSITEIKKSYQ